MSKHLAPAMRYGHDRMILVDTARRSTGDALIYEFAAAVRGLVALDKSESFDWATLTATVKRGGPECFAPALLMHVEVKGE